MVGIHLTAIALLIVIPAVNNLFHPKPKELVNFVEFVSEAPPAAQPVAEREPQPAAEPKPQPVVKQPVIKQPVIKKPVVEAPKPKPKPVPKKPKWKPAPVVRQDKHVTKKPTTTTPTTPVRKQITIRDIRKALGSSGSVDPFGAYYQTILARFYSVWQVPVGTAYGLSAQATITVGTNGTVSTRRLIRSSGNAAFDQSVQKALNTVSRLPAPPAGLPSRTITVEFVPQ